MVGCQHNHPLVDGNKRLGRVELRDFLDLNGIGPNVVTNDDVFDLVTWVAVESGEARAIAEGLGSILFSDAECLAPCLERSEPWAGLLPFVFWLIGSRQVLGVGWAILIGDCCTVCVSGDGSCGSATWCRGPGRIICDE